MVDNTRWQREAIAVLHRILLEHSDLPTLRWSLTPHGWGATGEVVAPDAYTIERTFADWQGALDLPVSATTADRLMSTGQLAGCRITITATLPDPRKDHI
jgi:hypothetical protein